MKMKDSINISTLQFRNLHPRGMVSDSDSYYARLANRILRTLSRDKLIVRNCNPHLLSLFSLHSAAYFEDVISGVGLFAAIRNMHQKLCGRKLPFFTFDNDDYFDDEINPQDIQFLLWCIVEEDFNERTDDDECQFINPENPLLALIVERIMDILDEEYETAPENEALYNCLHTAKLDDFFHFRDLLKWLHYDSYLSMQYPKNKLENERQSVLKEKDKWYAKNINVLSYSIETTRIFQRTCSPLSVHAAELLKEITSNPQLKETLIRLEFKVLNTYKIIDWKEGVVKISPIDNDNEILALARHSFDESVKIEKNNALTASLVLFNGLWQTNGFVAIGDLTEESLKRKKTANNDKIENNRDTILFTCKEIMKYTQNKPFAYFRNYDEYLDFCKKVFPDILNFDEFEKDNFLRDETNILLFTDPKNGIMLLPDIAAWIKSPDNKLYNKEEAAKYAFSILVGRTSAPLSLISHLIENDMLPDAAINSLSGAEHGRELVRDNQWFIVRFFQPQLFE